MRIKITCRKVTLNIKSSGLEAGILRQNMGCLEDAFGRIKKTSIVNKITKYY
jgi:hypothetical protein